jgi:hypothetical protein
VVAVSFLLVSKCGVGSVAPLEAEWGCAGPAPQGSRIRHCTQKSPKGFFAHGVGDRSSQQSIRFHGGDSSTFQP